MQRPVLSSQNHTVMLLPVFWPHQPPLHFGSKSSPWMCLDYLELKQIGTSSFTSTITMNCNKTLTWGLFPGKPPSLLGWDKIINK